MSESRVLDQEVLGLTMMRRPDTGEMSMGSEVDTMQKRENTGLPRKRGVNEKRIVTPEKDYKNVSVEV